MYEKVLIVIFIWEVSTKSCHFIQSYTSFPLEMWFMSQEIQIDTPKWNDILRYVHWHIVFFRYNLLSHDCQHYCKSLEKIKYIIVTIMPFIYFRQAKMSLSNHCCLVKMSALLPRDHEFKSYMCSQPCFLIGHCHYSMKWVTIVSNLWNTELQDVSYYCK